jgi:hypothetical protein
MRATWALGLAALLLLAGCVTPAALEAASVDPAGAMPSAALLAHRDGALVPIPNDVGTPVGALFGLGVEAFEPTMGVTSDGALYYAATARGVAIGFEPLVMKSVDAGETWTDVSPRLPTDHAVPPETNDPYLYVDPLTDRVFQFAMAPILTCSVLSWSDDGGASWTTNPHGCFTSPPWDHQTMVAAAPTTLPTLGYASVLHQCVNSIYAAVCSRSLDGGLTWTPGQPAFRGVEPAGGLCGGLHGHLHAAPDGTVYLPKEHCGAPMLAISRDDGTTWQTVQVADAIVGNGDPAVAVDAAGNVYYTFVDTVGALQLVVSTDGGASWGAPILAAPPGITAALPALAAGAEGKIVLAYPGTPDLGAEGFDASEDAHAKAKWHGYITISVDATSASPSFLTVRANPEDQPLVRGECGTVRCPGFVDFMDVVIGIDGRPYAAFVDACSDECEAAEKAENDVSMGVVGTIFSGPSLL